MNYSIVSFTAEVPTIKMNDLTARNLGIFEKKKCLISFGKQMDEAWLEFNQEINEQEVLIESSLIDHLLIDPKLKYEIIFNNQQLIIGPVVGVLVAKRAERLKENLDDYLVYYLLDDYNVGPLYVFAEEQINFNERKITGYIYDLSDQEWRESIYPFPSAIFRRIGINKNVYRELARIMGDRLFNSYFFDKWELWQWTKENHNLINYLPETNNDINKETIDNFINKYDGVYLKPINGSRGIGVYYLTLENDMYNLKDKYGEVQTFAPTEAIEFLQKLKNYIIQQPIKLKKFDERMIDYRVIIQKNEQNNWICSGILGRFGKKAGIASNYQRNGFARDGISTIQMQWDISSKKAFQKYEQIISLAFTFAKYLDYKAGPYIEFGMDIGIDEDEQLWIIEVNKRHDYSLFHSLDNKKVYYDIKLQPIIYAKKIAMQPL